jgi:hypothetical protein
MLVGEIYLPVERLMAYYGASGKGAHLPFNFQLIRLPWKAKEIAAAIERYEALLPSHAWAQLGARQSRQGAHCLARRRGTGAGGGDAVTDAARYAADVLRR